MLRGVHAASMLRANPCYVPAAQLHHTPAMMSCLPSSSSVLAVCLVELRHAADAYPLTELVGALVSASPVCAVGRLCNGTATLERRLSVL